ncbi:MAG: hypothetical protein AB7E32_17070 [Desulfovibrio sp.]
MKKFLILLLLLAAVAVYFGVVSVRTGDGEFSVKLNEQKAGEVVDTIKQKAGELQEMVKDKK